MEDAYDIEFPMGGSDRPLRSMAHCLQVPSLQVPLVPLGSPTFPSRLYSVSRFRVISLEHPLAYRSLRPSSIVNEELARQGNSATGVHLFR